MDRETAVAPVRSAVRPSQINRAWGVAATILSVLYTAILIPFAMVASLIEGGHRCTWIFRTWAWLIVRTCGITVEIEGLEHLDGLASFVLVSNHKSLFDIIAVFDAVPREMRFVAKREIEKVPGIGFILERSQNIVIDRAGGGRTIRRALAVARYGYSICVFAEGHRFADDEVHEFNEGAAWLAIATRLPCVPMAIRGTMALMPRGSMFVSPGRRIRLVLGRPIATDGLKSADRNELTRRLEAEVRAAFREYS